MQDPFQIRESMREIFPNNTGNTQLEWVLKHFLQLILLFSLAIPAFSQNHVVDSTTAYFTLKSSTPGYETWLDGAFVGKTPLHIFPVTAGEHTVLLRRTRTNSWMMTDWTQTFRIAPGDTLVLFALLKRPYSIKSEPYGAEVYLHGAFQGTTPLIVELPDTLAQTLTLIKAGFRPENVTCDPAGPQFLTIKLSQDQIYSVQQQQVYEQARLRKGRNGRKALIFTGLTVASGVAAILLNNKADNLYEQYRQAGDPEARERLFDRTEKYDSYAGIALGIFQANIGLSLYFFYKSQK